MLRGKFGETVDCCVGVRVGMLKGKFGETVCCCVGVRVGMLKSGGKKNLGGEVCRPGVGGGESFTRTVGVEVIRGIGERCGPVRGKVRGFWVARG